jgi:hypothetical protein
VERRLESGICSGCLSWRLSLWAGGVAEVLDWDCTAPRFYGVMIIVVDGGESGVKASGE